MGTPTLLCLLLALGLVPALCLQSAPQTQVAAGPGVNASGTHGAARTTPAGHSQWRGQTRGNFRQSYATPPQAAAPRHDELKELMTSLHDRVGILATLDEDQRHRLEVIDKKIDNLGESTTGRMESLKAQQLNFQQRLDSFEHIQRLARNTLDELKGETDNFLGTRPARELRYKQKNRNKLRDLSRQTRATATATDPVAINTAELFSTTESVPTGRALSGPDLESRLDALATFLVSLAYNVQETKQNVAKLLERSKVRQRQANRHRGQGGRLPSPVGHVPLAVPEERATSCWQSELAVKGILKLQLTPESDTFYVPCEEHGWMVVLNRSSDDISFERGWLDYKEGFGNLAGDFFIGLDKLHALTSSELHELRIWLEDFDGNWAVAGYDSFAISGERELYALSLLGKYQEQLRPPAGDSLSYQAGARFSTFDHDNDNCLECSCAQRHKAGGWFNSCATSNLMGVYHGNGSDYSRAGEPGIYWDTFQGKDYSLRRVKMLIRPVLPDEARR